MGVAQFSNILVRPLESSRMGFFSSLAAQDLAMDLGTANTLIYAKGRGVVLNEPSVVAVEEHSNKPIAVGHGAKEIFGKTSTQVRCVRPMKDGVIADFEMTSLMIRYFLSQIYSKWTMRRPRIVIGVPSGITQVEKKAVIDAAMTSGANKVMLVEEPMAAAIGADLPIDKAVGNMIVDIGGGTTEVAIISLGATAYSQSIRVAGDEMDEAIKRHVRKVHEIDIGIFEAERVKMVIGSALAFNNIRSIKVYGRDITSGMPKQVELTDEMIRKALNEPISAIIGAIMTALEQASPEFSQDIVSRGIYLAGGGALLKGLAERLQRETGLPFHRTQDPLSCVVRGVGQIVENLKEMRQLCIS